MVIINKYNTENIVTCRTHKGHRYDYCIRAGVPEIVFVIIPLSNILSISSQSFSIY